MLGKILFGLQQWDGNNNLQNFCQNLQNFTYPHQYKVWFQYKDKQIYQCNQVWTVLNGISEKKLTRIKRHGNLDVVTQSSHSRIQETEAGG